MSKGCLKCGTQNADDARFCRHCGTELTAATIDTAEPTPDAACRACGHLNRAGARFCSNCGADQLPPAPAGFTAAAMPQHAAPDPARKPVALWVALGAIVLAFVAWGAWWLSSPGSPPPPTFDSAPPPSVLGAASSPASSPMTPASMPAATLPSPPTPAIAPIAPTSKPTSDLWEPADKNTVITEPSEKESQAAKDKAAREAKAKALREQRALAASQAEADLARRRVEETRPVPTTPPPPRVVAQPRTVQERCSNRSALLQGICEARECMHSEHTNEAVCERIRANDERRRNPS